MKRRKRYRKSKHERIQYAGFHFYLLEEERWLLNYKSKQFHMSNSKYLRTLIAHGKVPWKYEKFFDEGRQCLREIDSISNNLSLIKYYAKETDPTYTDICELKEAFSEILQQVWRITLV